VTDTGSVLSPAASTEVAKPTIHQVASIVKDLDASVARLQQTMGWGPWDVYEYVPGRLRELTVRGEPAEFTWIGAEVAIGPETYVELLQPTSPSGIFHEWLSTRGEGMHHVGYWAPSIEEAQRMFREMTADGTEVLLSAWIDDVYFYYLDTHPMIFEVWAGDLDSLSPVRQIGAPGES
jgi:methylmalonyl-CoA/ethylmalonyl-CoA epimerase